MSYLTTIKVSSQTRDRLKRGARAQDSTLEAYLLALVTEQERHDRLAAMRAAMKAASDDVMADYAAEAAEWEQIQAIDAHG